MKSVCFTGHRSFNIHCPENDTTLLIQLRGKLQNGGVLMKRSSISLLVLFLSATLFFSGCELDTSTDSISSAAITSKTSITTTALETEGSTTPSETSSAIEETTVSTTSMATTASTTSTTTTASTTSTTTSVLTYVLNTNTKKIHFAYCSSVDNMKESNKAFTNDYAKAIADGYKPCKRCNP